jgi:hypothetical protein
MTPFFKFPRKPERFESLVVAALLHVHCCQDLQGRWVDEDTLDLAAREWIQAESIPARIEQLRMMDTYAATALTFLVHWRNDTQPVLYKRRPGAWTIRFAQHFHGWAGSEWPRICTLAEQQTQKTNISGTAEPHASDTNTDTATPPTADSTPTTTTHTDPTIIDGPQTEATSPIQAAVPPSSSRPSWKYFRLYNLNAHHESEDARNQIKTSLAERTRAPTEENDADLAMYGQFDQAAQLDDDDAAVFTGVDTLTPQDPRVEDVRRLLDQHNGLFPVIVLTTDSTLDDQLIHNEPPDRARWKNQLSLENTRRQHAVQSGITNPNLTAIPPLHPGSSTSHSTLPTVTLENPEKVTIDSIIDTGASRFDPVTHQVEPFCVKLLGTQARATRLGCEAIRLSLLGQRLTKTEWLRMLVVGEGGAGKSVVADNIRRYAELNGRPDLVIVMASTAKASQNVKGQTFDSVTGYYKNKISQQAKKIWERTGMGLIDEYSQISLENLGHLANRINASEAASGRFNDWDPADELGHVHVILVGDQLQLPPVGGTPVYAWAEAMEQHGGMGRFFESAQGKKSAALMLGRHVYDLFSTVIEINGPNYRFKDDHEWHHFTRRIRYAYSDAICGAKGRDYWIEHDVLLHNSRVLDGPEEGAPKSTDPEWAQAPLITHDNLTRLMFGVYRIIARAKQHNRKAIGYRTMDYDGDTGRPLQQTYPRLATYLKNVDKQANMAHDFLFTPGIRASPPQNTRWGKYIGVINGADMIMKQIALDPREPSAPMPGEPRYDPDVHWLQYPPLYIICLVVGSSVQLDGLPCGCVPVYYDPSHSFQWQLSTAQRAYLKNVRGKPILKLNIKRANVPALCVEGKTCYGVQGSTFHHVIGMWPKGNGNLGAAKMYTTLSRPTGSKAYASLTRITAHDLKRLYVPKDILTEERRLHRLAALTRVHYAHPDDPPSPEDHRIAAEGVARPTHPPRPRVARPAPPASKAVAPIRKHPLAQTQVSKADGLQATLKKRATRPPANPL